MQEHELTTAERVEKAERLLQMVNEERLLDLYKRTFDGDDIEQEALDLAEDLEAKLTSQQVASVRSRFLVLQSPACGGEEIRAHLRDQYSA